MKSQQGKNNHVVAMKGNFDDAQKGVKGFVLGTSVLFGHKESYKEILSELRAQTEGN